VAVPRLSAPADWRAGSMVDDWCLPVAQAVVPSPGDYSPLAGCRDAARADSLAGSRLYSQEGDSW